MTANYHTHTWRCKHASGTEREYVEAAIRGGIRILGFSDHTPMPYPDGYVSRVKMDMGQLGDYVETVLALREEYRDDIEIHLGLEVEYYPALFDELCRFTDQYPIEYFLLGQHCLGNEIGDVSSFDPTDDENLLARYSAQVVEAMKTGRFCCVAHPDVFHFTGGDEAYERRMRIICETALALDIPLEINLLGIGTHRHYPDPRFWKMAGEVGNRVIFGSDAHKSSMVWNPEAYRKGLEIVGRFGLHLTETMRLARTL